jgi:hypothetical protein
MHPRIHTRDGRMEVKAKGEGGEGDCRFLPVNSAAARALPASHNLRHIYH